MRVGGVFVDPRVRRRWTALLVELTGETDRFEAVVDQAKREVVEQSLYAEVHRLTELVVETCHADVALRDHPRRHLQAALVELLVAFDRYRAYVVPDEPAPDEQVAVVEAAAARARERLPEEAREALDVVVDLVLARPAGTLAFDGREAARRRELAVRFQQTCGPVMAKGVEDTAFYRWHRLVALNEVGRRPDALRGAARGVPRVRRPAAAGLAGDDDDAVDPRHQTLRGRPGAPGRRCPSSPRSGPRRSAPGPSRRCGSGRRRAARTRRPVPRLADARRYLGRRPDTARPARPVPGEGDPGGEAASPRGPARTLPTTRPSRRTPRPCSTTRSCSGTSPGSARCLDPVARVNSLGQKLVQLTMPGVPDVYQGCEGVDLSLVDPDNRRDVDFDDRRARLARLDAGGTATDLADEKLLVTSRALRLRREHPDWFAGPASGYAPVGTTTGNALAFARGPRVGNGNGDGAAPTPSAVTVVTRLPVALERHGGWGDHTIFVPEGRWRDALTGITVAGGAVRLADLLGRLPVALLVREG